MSRRLVRNLKILLELSMLTVYSCGHHTSNVTHNEASVFKNTAFRDGGGRKAPQNSDKSCNID